MPISLADAAILLHPDDDVAVARRPLPAGTAIALPDGAATTTTAVPYGHKFAMRSLAACAVVRKFGQPIGVATRSIAPAEHVHTHNLAWGDLHRAAELATAPPAPFPPPERDWTFDGFLRPDGRVGTRNYLAVIGTVNCSATVCKRIAARFADGAKDFPHLDGVFAVTHATGCAMAANGADHARLQRTLAGYATHPNVFGYVLVGLGCEVNQASELVQIGGLGRRGGRPPPVIINIQAVGGTGKAIEAGVRAIAELLPAANGCRRTPQPLQRLVLGTNCGGSDGHSGITANPALGVASDLLIAAGGTSVLAETTEIHGAEHLLARRAVSPAVAQKLLDKLHWWEDYCRALGATLDNNPSPGNKAGGLTTILEKSLGAVAKGGSAALAEVIGYAEPIVTPGLVVMDTPGFDPVSVTGIIAGGANVVAFTTGRGSAFGSKPAPTLKIATNTPLFESMPDDMDLDAGTILAGESLAAAGRRIFEAILATASGRPTKSEAQGLGDEEFVPWISGPTL